jgi:hypothetical protein
VLLLSKSYGDDLSLSNSVFIYDVSDDVFGFLTVTFTLTCVPGSIIEPHAIT